VSVGINPSASDLQAEILGSGELGRTPQRIENMSRFDSDLYPVFFKNNPANLIIFFDTDEPSSGVDFDPILPERYFKRASNISIRATENMWTPLNEGDTTPESAAIAGQFQSHWSTAKNNEGVWYLGSIEHIITRQATRFRQT
jgi:hypothetical protein